MITRRELDRAITDLLNASLSPHAKNIVYGLLNSLESPNVPNTLPINPGVGYVIVKARDSDVVIWTGTGGKASHGTIISKDPKTKCDGVVGSHIAFDKYATVDFNGDTYQIVHIDQIYGTVEE